MRGSPPNLVCSYINQVLTTCLSSLLFSKSYVFSTYSIQSSFSLCKSLFFSTSFLSYLFIKINTSSLLYLYISSQHLFHLISSLKSSHLLFFISTYLPFNSYSCILGVRIKSTIPLRTFLSILGACTKLSHLV